MCHLIIEDWGGNTQFNPLKRIKWLNHYHTERQAGGRDKSVEGKET